MFLLLALLCAVILLPRLGKVCGLNARESVLRNDLQTMREAIDNYTADKGRPPQSLQILVDEKYLRAIPINPITRKSDWVPHHVRTGDQKSAVGIDDVHASAGEASDDGAPYSDW